MEPASNQEDKRLDLSMKIFDSFVKNSQVGNGWHFIDICPTEVSSVILCKSWRDMLNISV